MSPRMSYFLKYMVPALLIILTTFELVQVALTSLYDEKQHKLSTIGVMLEHQIKATHVTFDPNTITRDQLEQKLQPVLNSLYLEDTDLGGGIYWVAQERLAAFAPRSNLHGSITDHYAKSPEISATLASGKPNFFTVYSSWRHEKTYSYLIPLQENGQVVAILCLSQPYKTFSQQLETIYLSGMIICLLALMFLTVAAVGEYRRWKNLNQEQDRLVNWLKQYDEHTVSPELQGNKFTLLRELPTEFQNAIQLAQFERKQKQHVLNELPIGIMTLDSNHQIHYANPYFGRLIGYEPEEITRWSLEEWRAHYRLYDDGYLGDIYEREPIENRRGLLQHKSGAQIPFAVTVRTLLDENNGVFGYLLMFNDLSNEFERNRLEQKTHHIFNSVPLSVILTDAAHKIEYINPAVSRMFGCNEHELIGQTFGANLPWTFPQQELNLEDQLSHVQLTGVRGRITNVTCLMQGREYDLELDFFPITNPFSGETDGCMTLIKDMTLAREWEELSQRIDMHSSYVQMAATIAHEVRNPMTSVRGFLQLLGSSSELSDDKQRMYIDVMQTEIDRMNAILSEYLSMARTPQPQWECIHLDDLIRETLLVLEGEANYRGITLALDLKPDCMVHGLSRELKQVLINLVRNAYDAMNNTNGRIDIGLCQTESSFLIHVSDTGCGISAEQLDRIFDPFFTTKVMGTGLGLPVCKKIVESHHGTLSVQSVVGAGTTFTIELP
ncbi:MAG: ATP-binding protein, partial [Tumebacillaceae bacterium]